MCDDCTEHYGRMRLEHTRFWITAKERKSLNLYHYFASPCAKDVIWKLNINPIPINLGFSDILSHILIELSLTTNKDYGDIDVVLNITSSEVVFLVVFV